LPEGECAVEDRLEQARVLGELRREGHGAGGDRLFGKGGALCQECARQGCHGGGPGRYGLNTDHAADSEGKAK
jgi:hypothetical protein